MGLKRSEDVILDENITKIQLWTGPQSITGSTRMQASTSEQFVISVLLEEAVIRSLEKVLDSSEMEAMGFTQASIRSTIRDRIQSFIEV
jgi:N-acetylmuramic acid 6-phosphate etherase